ELAYGLLLLERCYAAAPGSTVGSMAVEAAAAPVHDLTAGANSAVSLRAQLAGQLDLILRQPDARGLASYDLALLKFFRWYSALGLPGERALRQAGSAAPPLSTQSYGVNAAE